MPSMRRAPQMVQIYQTTAYGAILEHPVKTEFSVQSLESAGDNGSGHKPNVE
jgi:hypothetical protein